MSVQMPGCAGVLGDILMCLQFYMRAARLVTISTSAITVVAALSLSFINSVCLPDANGWCAGAMPCTDSAHATDEFSLHALVMVDLHLVHALMTAIPTSAHGESYHQRNCGKDSRSQGALPQRLFAF